jgi:hypothetical protein
MANKRLVQKASKKTSLPTVEASPAKGGGSRDNVGGEDSISLDESLTMVAGEGTSVTSKEDAIFGEVGDIFMVPMAKGADEVQVVKTLNAEKSNEKGKEKDKLKSQDSSRRASMALSQLSQSLSAAPAYGTSKKEGMGPPATPRKIVRSVSSSYPATSSVSAEVSIASTATSTRSGTTSPDKALGPGGTRFSARQAAKAASNAEAKSPSTSVDPSGSNKKASGEKEKTSAKKSESLSILKDCRIFVDVRTDDGEEAGSLFVEMLESLGAKVRFFVTPKSPS